MSRDRSALLSAAREARLSESGRAMLNLLKAQVEHWKEISIGMPADHVAHYHGAIIRVRELIAEIESDPRKRPTRESVSEGF